jgi:lantibiotic modifying enzyme
MMKAASAGIQTGEFLRTAEEIGRRISQQAVWHEDRCNWLGAEPRELSDAQFQIGVTYRALGPNLYSGTSGVALYLAELNSITQEPLLRRVALGAVRQALSRIDAMTPSARFGLFSGSTGVAFVAIRLAILLDEPELLDKALFRLHQSESVGFDNREFDIVSGRAGAIAALVVLNHILDDSFLLDFAIRLGDELLETADKTNIGYSWQSPGLRNQNNLTGFSHGAAGVAYALLELFQATGDLNYRNAASLALEYERHWYEPSIGNWPDFREDLSSTSRNNGTRSFAVFWCHGAPGIALSRLRAYEILNDQTCKAEALAALKTTRESIESALDTLAGNFSMCHGLAGNAEVLIYGAEIMSPEPEKEPALALSVANFGIERYSAVCRSPWPCGTHVGETPNLMLGLAGIGHFYLRLYQPLIPSILILRKEAWRIEGRDIQDLVKPLNPITLDHN